MVSRLNAKQAAALTSTRAKEIEAQVRQQELENRLRFTQLRKKIRLWNAQANHLIESALSKKTHLDVNSSLIGADTLVRNGFAIYYVDMVSFTKHQQQLILKQEEEKRIRKYKIDSLSFVVRREIDDLVREFGGNDQFKGMTLTKENSVKHLLAKVEEYRSGISTKNAERGCLFRHIFDGQLYLFRPIESLRTKSQTVQNALHNLESLRHEFDDNETSDLDEAKNVDDDSYFEIAEQKPAIPARFRKYLRPSECSEYMEVKNDTDFYQIEWETENIPKGWFFEDLISARALGWLAGPYGQNFLDIIESRVRSAVDDAASTVSYKAAFQGVSWFYDLGQSTIEIGPYPNQLSKILRVLGYKVDNRKIGEQSVTMNISW